MAGACPRCPADGAVSLLIVPPRPDISNKDQARVGKVGGACRPLPEPRQGETLPAKEAPGPFPYRTVPLRPRATKDRRNVGQDRPTRGPIQAARFRSTHCLFLASTTGRGRQDPPPSTAPQGPGRYNATLLSEASPQVQCSAHGAVCRVTF